jgi:CDP-4-dehydro-6-deoxyglucose reductase
MATLLTLSRAARLVGLPRGALQKKVKDGELPTFEGKVHPDDLLHAYPQARLEDDTALERLTHIKDHAYAQRVRERLLPDAEILVARLHALSQDLVSTKATLEQYRSTVEHIQNELDRIADASDDDVHAILATIRHEIAAQLGRDPETKRYGHLLIRDSFLRVMAAHVHVRPSNHEFFVEGSDTLLEAALRAGLALDYGCSNGNCGRCKARVVSGETKKVRNHDFVMSEADKAAHFVLLCAHTAVTDLFIEAPEARGVQDIPLQQIATRVKTLERLNDDMMLLRVQTPRTNRLRFLAGQYATLQIGDARADHYIASCPCDDRNLEFHIPRQPDSAVADQIFTNIKSGHVVGVEGPKGHFVLNEESHRSILFVAIDTGFAPIKSLIEHAMALNTADALYLCWVVGDTCRHYLHNLCRSWADALDNFQYAPVMAKDSPAIADTVRRVVSGLPTLPECDVYVAGGRTQVSTVIGVLRERSVPEAQIYFDHIELPLS